MLVDLLRQLPRLNSRLSSTVEESSIAAEGGRTERTETGAAGRQQVQHYSANYNDHGDR